MGAISPLHLIIVLVIAVLILGPGKLPEVGAALGGAMKSMRDAMEGRDATEGVAGATATATAAAAPALPAAALAPALIAAPVTVAEPAAAVPIAEPAAAVPDALAGPGEGI